MMVENDRILFLVFYDARTESDSGKANIGGEFKLSLIVDQPKSSDKKAVP